MNQKAQLFQDRLEKLSITAFQWEEIPGDMNAVVFYSNLEVNAQKMRLQIILDDSMYVVVRIYVAEGLITGSRKYRALKVLNSFNKDFKLFKFYVDDVRDIVFDCNMTFTDDTFNPQLVQQAIALAQDHLKREYAGMIKAIKNK